MDDLRLFCLRGPSVLTPYLLEADLSVLAFSVGLSLEIDPVSVLFLVSGHCPF